MGYISIYIYIYGLHTYVCIYIYIYIFFFLKLIFWWGGYGGGTEAGGVGVRDLGLGFRAHIIGFGGLGNPGFRLGLRGLVFEISFYVGSTTVSDEKALMFTRFPRRFSGLGVLGF